MYVRCRSALEVRESDGDLMRHKLSRCHIMKDLGWQASCAGDPINLSKFDAVGSNTVDDMDRR